MVDINKLYGEVLEKNYKTKKYTLPTIGWSKEYTSGRYGEYQSWKNHIEISRLLNTEKISKEAIMSVIYHELLHQDNEEHDENFNKKVNKFPSYEKYHKELIEYFDAFEIPEVDTPNRFAEGRNNFILCLLKDKDYIEDFRYYNRKVYIDVGSNKIYPEDSLNIDNPFIIWLVAYRSDYYVVGWSDSALLFKQQQKIQHRRYGGLDFKYQAITKGENCFILPPCNCEIKISKSLLPVDFKEVGAHYIDPNSKINLNWILQRINSYAGEFETIGLLDENIYAIYPMIENNTEKIIKKSMEETQLRGLWLANLAVEKEKSYETLLNRADALRYATVFDYAQKEFLNTIKLLENEDAIIATIKLSVMLEDKQTAEKLLYCVKKTSISKDKELKKCIEYLSNS